MALLGALDILDYVAGDLFLHCQRFITFKIQFKLHSLSFIAVSQHFYYPDGNWPQPSIIIITIQMNPQNKNCNLHSHPYQYFCEKCYEPICQQCTLTGPHNTPIHPISNLPDAYERRVHEVNQRIAAFLQNKNTIIESIETLSSQIEELKMLKESSLDENNRYRSKMLQELQKQQERIRNEIILIKQQFQTKLNEINDLGHMFQTINDHIEIIASHSNILQSIKECLDRLKILLDNRHSFSELPKELSDLRLDLKSIEAYKQLIEQKVKVIKEIFSAMEAQKGKIEQPTIDYALLLKQLSANVDSCIEHNVCHYCGTIFTMQAVNTSCPKNNSALDINQFIGYCSKKPDSIRWATHRHFFGQPAKKYQFYKTQEINSFSIHLRALLLKLKTICLIKNINLYQQFRAADKGKTDSCNQIEMMYILMEICGLTVDESQIMLTLCDQPSKDVYTYDPIVKRLSEVEIEASEKKLQLGSLLGAFTRG